MLLLLLLCSRELVPVLAVKTGEEELLITFSKVDVGGDDSAAILSAINMVVGLPERGVELKIGV